MSHILIEKTKYTSYASGKQIGTAVEIAERIETQRKAISHLEELTTTLHDQHDLLESSARIHDTFMQLR